MPSSPTPNTTIVSSSPATSAPSPPPSSFLQNITSLGLGYAIAIALGSLVLLSSLLLASYICCRSRPLSNPNPNPNPNGQLVLPRSVFVDDNDDEEPDTAGPCGAVGLDPAAIGSYPKFAYSSAKEGGGGENVCSVCLCEYREGETLRMMAPDCRHYFHVVCIDAWLALNASCPVCRTSPMPTPLSTPLSELVPLSHFSADRRSR